MLSLTKSLMPQALLVLHLTSLVLIAVCLFLIVPILDACSSSIRVSWEDPSGVQQAAEALKDTIELCGKSCHYS